MRSAALLVVAACSANPEVRPPAPPPPPAPRMTLADTGIVPEWLDRATDPCRDFFDHACGGFVASASIPPDRSSWGAIQIAAKRTEEVLRDILEKAAAEPGRKIGDEYAACMDEAAVDRAGTAPLAPLLDTIARVKDGRSAAEAVMALHASAVFPFFVIAPTQDFADATQVIAGLDQEGDHGSSTLGMPDRDYYLLDEGNLKDVRAAYVKHVGRMFALLGAKPAEVEAATADVMRIETALAKAQQDKVVRREPHNVYHRVERKGLEAAAASFPWGEYLARVGIPTVTAITVNEPSYYVEVARMLQSERPAALRHYLSLTLARRMAPHLGRAFVAEDFALQQVLSGVKEDMPRWRRCVRQVDSDLGELLGQAYVEVAFGGPSKQRAAELTRALLDAMGAEIDRLPWMDAPTRVAAKDKLGKMLYLVGYPDRWRQYDFLVARDDFVGDVLRARRFEQARQLAKIGKPVDRFDWEMTPPTVNAYYEATLNELALPAGQLQPPFFGATFHPAVNFGSTGGGTIGHEMTHGFDDEGSQFDGDGNLRDWWSAPTKKQFDDASQCVVEQYAQYEAVPGVKLNGKLTAGENIADIGGVKLGLEAYRDWKRTQAAPPPGSVDGYSDEQLYFLAYAQSWCEKDTPQRLETMAHSNPHSPARWRVNGVIVDEPGFAPAFHCAAGAPMNPGKRCAVW
jgi:predicted metalloendopeptidase